MHDRKKIDARGHWSSVRVNVEFCLQLIAPKPRGGAGEVSCKIFFNLSWIYQLVFLDFLFFYCCSNHWCNKHINQLLKDIKPLEEREVGTFSIPDFFHFTPDLQQKLVVEVWGFLLFFFFFWFPLKELTVVWDGTLKLNAYIQQVLKMSDE